MADVRKTIDEYDIQADYGQGYETVTCEPTLWAARQAVKEYRENEPGVPLRIKKLRVHKSKLTRDQVDDHFREVIAANNRMLESLKKRKTQVN